jgi:toxin ParE1/3/4
MKIQTLIRAEAEADLAEAFLWYEHQKEGLGDNFLLCVEAALHRIERNPESFQVIHKNVRRTLVKRFPYGVFYTLTKTTLAVIAVFHAKRNPKRWRRRS